MARPSVAIIIAAHNEERHLDECLRALRAQSYPAKIYLVDDGSTDKTGAIARLHPGVKVLRSQGIGQGAARNLALAEARSDLVGFLDAHCIPNEGWISAMVQALQPPRVGACQGSIESRADDPRVQAYLERTGSLSNERILDDTVRGRKNLYPWILSGNSMYRREALDAAGGFNPALRSCEDVELAWRVLLGGFEFRYVPSSRVVHYDGNPWHSFLRKGYRYARGAADLARCYRDHGASDKFAPAPLWAGSFEATLIGLYYRLGYYLKSSRLSLGLERPSIRPPLVALAHLRPHFEWADGSQLQISPEAVYWFDTDDRQSTVVHVPQKQRLVLDGVGHLIWKALTEQAPREQIAALLVDSYGISPVTARADLDDFIEELREARVLR